MNFSKESNKKKQKSLDSKKNKASKTVSTSFVKILAFAFLLFIIVGVCAGIGFVKSIIDAAPAISVDDIVPEGYASFVYDQNGNEIAKLYGTDANRIPKELDEIPKYLQESFVVIEDERFWEHNGIDLKGIFRAVFTNLKEKRLSEGASTITQQLIKNNVLTNAETFERKIQEQYLAMEIEKKSSKEKILENYLNTVALGRGTNGVQSAANKYFNKDVAQLTIAESAVIAAITQRPTYYDPVINPENNKQRQSIILKKLLDLEKITQAEYDVAINENVYENIQIVKNTMPSTSTQSYYVDEVYKQVKEDLMVQKGYTEAQAENLIYRGGLSIYINQDLEMQKILDEAYMNEENFPSKNEDYGIRLHYNLSVEKEDGIKHYYKEKEFETDQELEDFLEQYKKDMIGPNDKFIAENKTLIPQPQSAMVVMDQHTGEVKAMVGGRGEKKGNLTLNRATYPTTRQPGSTFKVLAAYLPAIDTAGYTLATVLDDVPTKFPGQNKIWPKNYYKQFKGLSTVREGIVYSMNIITVKTLNDIGVQTGFDYLLDLGFTSLVEREERNGEIFTDKGLPLALGGITDGVTVLELTAAYAAIANNGVYNEPTFYTKVLNHDNKIILEKKPAPRTVMKETTAYLLTNALVDAVVRGTGKKVNFKTQPIAGKTGTTSEDKDIWFAGYTPYYTAVLWEGFDYAKELDSYAGYHKTLWRYVMERIHKDLPRKEFKRPSGIVPAKICTESGQLAVEGLCDLDPRGSTVRTEYFAKGTVPTEECTTHIKATICKDSGLFTNEFCPEDSKIEQVYIQRDPSVVIWDPNKPPNIRDLEHEMPPSMIGEYCNIHGPVVQPPVIPLPQDYIDGEEGNNPPSTDPAPFDPLQPNDPVGVVDPEEDTEDSDEND